jgi:hypothetical protein
MSEELGRAIGEFALVKRWRLGKVEENRMAQARSSASWTRKQAYVETQQI